MTLLFGELKMHKIQATGKELRRIDGYFFCGRTFSGRRENKNKQNSVNDHVISNIGSTTANILIDHFLCIHFPQSGFSFL